MSSEEQTTDTQGFWGDRQHLIMVAAMVLVTVVVLAAQDRLFLATDYLCGFYPFLGYPEFQTIPTRVINAHYQDVSFYFFPYWEFAGDRIAAGEIPLWNPMEGAGLPVAGAHVEGAMFPLRWLTYGLLPAIWAWQIELVLIFVVSVVSAYYFFKAVTGSRAGSTSGRPVLGFGGRYRSLLSGTAGCLAGSYSTPYFIGILAS